MALKTAERIEKAYRRPLILGFIAVDQAQAGFVDDALKTFASALKTAESIKLGARDALLNIAKAQAQAGFVDEALRTAETIGNAIYRAQALSDIAKAREQAWLADDDLESDESLERAYWRRIAMAESENSAADKARALGEIAKSIALLIKHAR